MSAEASRDNRVTIWAVVPAAGSGSRMQATLPKQYLQLAGKPVIEHALTALYAVPRIAGVVVAGVPGPISAVSVCVESALEKWLWPVKSPVSSRPVGSGRVGRKQI